MRKCILTFMAVFAVAHVASGDVVRQYAVPAAACGEQALAPGEKGVDIRNNRVILAPESPLRRLSVTAPRKDEVSAEKDGL